MHCTDKLGISGEIHKYHTDNHIGNVNRKNISYDSYVIFVCMHNCLHHGINL